MMVPYNGIIDTIRRILGMKIIPGSRRRHYVARFSIFLVTVALIAGVVGCGQPEYTPRSPQAVGLKSDSTMVAAGLEIELAK